MGGAGGRIWIRRLGVIGMVVGGRLGIAGGEVNFDMTMLSLEVK